MEKESRVHKSLLNAKVGLIFYFLTLVVTFYSRKVFLDFLGPEFMGLTGTLNSILSVLNLAEFGIGGSIAYFLYGPIAEGNKLKINDIVSVCGYMYRIVGAVIFCGGFCVSCFFPFWFSTTSFNLSLVYFAFYSILGSALIGYFINYKNQLLYADQKQYLIQGYFQTGNIIKNIIQIIVALYYANLYLWVVLEFVYSIACCIILNLKIKKEYPWLDASASKGKVLFKDYRHIFQKCKQIMVHSLKNFVLNKSDELFIFGFVSLKMVAFYGNYVLIIGKIADLIRIPFNGMLASVGNLVAEGNKQRIHDVFWEVLSILYFMAALAVAGIYFYISPVISLWLGEEYVLGDGVVLLLCINTFITITYSAIYYFNNAYGNYHDVWASWAEAALNICVTVVAAWKLGIVGILIGKLVSTSVFLVIWKPQLLYYCGFKTSIREYWKNIGILLSLVILYMTTIKLMQVYFPLENQSIMDMLVNILLCYIPATIFFIVVYSKFAPGADFVINRIKTKMSWK